MEKDIIIDNGYSTPDGPETGRVPREPELAELYDLTLLELTRELYDMLTSRDTHPERETLYEDYKLLMDKMGGHNAHYIKRDPKVLEKKIEQLNKAA